jgi:DNA-binding response OmpR family regulator
MSYAPAVTDLGVASAEGVRIAVIDTDSGFLKVLDKRLDRIGWEYRTLAGPVPIEELVAMRLGALVIDLSILGPQAWEYLERVCDGVPGLGVIVCTGRASVAQRVRGLRLGADDWVPKPCHPEELIARVEAVTRRRRRSDSREVAEVKAAGELEIKPDLFQAFVGERSANLTRREFELVELLASVDGRVLEREEIYQRVWGYAMARGDRSVDVFVRKVRHKLEKASPDWKYIHTHFGVGYRFAAELREGAIEIPDAPPADLAPARKPGKRARSKAS